MIFPNDFTTDKAHTHHRTGSAGDLNQAFFNLAGESGVSKWVVPKRLIMVPNMGSASTWNTINLFPKAKTLPVMIVKNDKQISCLWKFIVRSVRIVNIFHGIGWWFNLSNHDNDID